MSDGLHAKWRTKGQDRCPIDGYGVSTSKCSPCKFFRGSSSYLETKLLCNWPVNGSEVYEGPTVEAPAYVCPCPICDWRRQKGLYPAHQEPS